MKKTIILLLSLVLLLTGCSSLDNLSDELVDQTSNVLQKDDKYVLTIQNANISNYTYTYKEVFDNFFAYPTWKHFTSDTNQEVVEFTGECIYDNAQVKAKIQFVITSENDDYVSFEASYLSFNDINQPLIMLATLIEKAVEEYDVSNDTVVEYDTSLDLNIEESKTNQEKVKKDTRINELESKLSELNDEISGIYQKIDIYKNAVLGYEQKIQESRNLIVEHEKTIIELQNSNDDYKKSQVRDYNQYIENCKRSITDSENGIKFYNGLINQQNEEMMEIETEKEEITRELNNLKNIKQ